MSPEKVWRPRYDHINNFEETLHDEGVTIRKFYLHISKDYQKRRLQKRLDNPKKHWKFNPCDLKERERWDDYQEAYEEMVQNTATNRAPWYVVPADNKWYARLVVASAIIQTLGALDLAFPDVDKEKKKELSAIREALLRDKD